MSFSKLFFDDLGALSGKYHQKSPCATFTLTIKAYGKEYNVESLLEARSDLVAFTYYDSKKSHTIPRDVAVKRHRDLKAFPLLVIPYGSIEWIEFNPGDASNGPIGFGGSLTRAS